MFPLSSARLAANTQISQACRMLIKITKFPVAPNIYVNKHALISVDFWPQKSTPRH